MVIVPIVAKEFANHFMVSIRNNGFICLFVFFCGQIKLSFIQWN